MRPRWIILGLFLASIAFGTIIWWPERALWTTKVRAELQAPVFSEDNKSIFLVEEKENDENKPRQPHFSRWDILTGRLLQETALRFPEPLKFSPKYEIGSNGRLIIGRDSVTRETGPDLNAFFVMDTLSGKKLLGPIYCSGNSYSTAKFSRDGHWIAYTFSSEKQPANDGGIEVIDSKTGNKILRVDKTVKESIDTCFSPDGSSIALLLGDRSEVFSVRTFALPSGKEQNRIPLTKREWTRLDRWESHYLTVFANASDDSDNFFNRIIKVFTIDLESTPIGKETEHPKLEQRYGRDKSGRIETNWLRDKSGNGWRAEIKSGGDEELDWIWTCWNKCTEWIGAQKKEEALLQITLRVVDSDTNQVRYQSRRFSNSVISIASNGTLYAVFNYEIGELSVWNATQSRQWPWALAASLGTLLLILLLGRWRTKRLARS